MIPSYDLQHLYLQDISRVRVASPMSQTDGSQLRLELSCVTPSPSCLRFFPYAFNPSEAVCQLEPVRHNRCIDESRARDTAGRERV